MKKQMTLSILLLSLMATSTVFAANYYWGDSRHYAKSTEQAQLRYKGEAYTVKGLHAQVTYYSGGASGAYLGGAYAYLDSWDPRGSIYNSVIVWDSLNPVANKTKIYYSL